MNIYIHDDGKIKRVASKGYNHFFNKVSGFSARWGENVDDDPDYAPGPEIADIEISAGGLCRAHCPWCYKSNGQGEHANMTLDTFKQIFDKLPKTLCQIAFGITDIDANPDFLAIMQYARDNGVVPNFTTNEFIKSNGG